MNNSYFFLVFFLVESVRDALLVTKMLKLKRLRDHIEQENFMNQFNRRSSSILDESSLADIGIAHEFELYPFIHAIMERKTPLYNLNFIKTSSFKGLDRDLRFEILKNTISRKLKTRWCHVFELPEFHCNLEILELQIIFTFLDFIVYENRSSDSAPKKSFLVSPTNATMKSLEESAGRFISYSKDSPDCVTLIVENQEIYVNSYLLTTNSPVFEAMLTSTSFKEGQSKRIKLPGKKYTEILFFLHYLQTPQDIRDIFGESVC